MIKLRFIKDKHGIVERAVGEVHEYKPWPHDFQGVSEPDRVASGKYVICYGMGEFEILNEGEDVERMGL